MYYLNGFAGKYIIIKFLKTIIVNKFLLAPNLISIFKLGKELLLV